VRANREALTVVIEFGERLRPFPTEMWAYNHFGREPTINHIFMRQGDAVVARADVIRDLMFVGAALLDPDPNNLRAEEARHIFALTYSQLGLDDFAQGYAQFDRNAALANAGIMAGPLHTLLSDPTPQAETRRILDKTKLQADDRDFLIGLNSALQGCFLTAKSVYDAYVLMKMPEKAQDALRPLVAEARMQLLRDTPPFDIKTATIAEVMAHPDTLKHPLTLGRLLESFTHINTEQVVVEDFARALNVAHAMLDPASEKGATVRAKIEETFVKFDIGTLEKGKDAAAALRRTGESGYTDAPARSSADPSPGGPPR
jgi:hypothetical protein